MPHISLVIIDSMYHCVALRMFHFHFALHMSCLVSLSLAFFEIGFVILLCLFGVHIHMMSIND